MTNSDNESEAAKTYRSESKSGKESCLRCTVVEKKISTKHLDDSEVGNVFIVHAERSITGGRKSKDKTEILQEIEKKVAALRNTKGGKLLFHIEGQQEDRSLEFLDELIHERFEGLIGDGTLYTDSYNREWLSDTSGYEEYYDVVLIHVEKARRVSTVDFHSLVRKDHENKRPTTENIIAILSKVVATSTSHRSVDFNSSPLQESRCVELKTFKPGPKHRVETVEEIVNYIWTSLKLKDNITSISKVEGGGSYFVGIAEEELFVDYTITKISEEEVKATYKTKKIEKRGFHLPVDTEEFCNTLKEKIKNDLCILRGGVFGEPSDDFVKLQLHIMDDSQPKVVVLEVIISHIDGLVFNDKNGPRTYHIVDKTIVRMEKEEWLQRIMSLQSAKEE